MAEELDHAELLRRLKRAMRKLPQQTRAVFLAHRVEAMPYDEIAERTGLCVREVEAHMALAMYRLCKEADREPLRWSKRWLRR